MWMLVDLCIDSGLLPHDIYLVYATFWINKAYNANYL